MSVDDGVPVEGDVTFAPSTEPGPSGEPLSHEQIVARLTETFGELRHEVHRGELTVFVDPDQLLEVVRFATQDPELTTEMLADLCGVHWPAGDHVIERQTSTTGWPEYRVSRERGVIEVDYVLRSVTRNHWFRVSVGVSDEDGHLPSVTELHPTADFHEREVFDMFGVVFDGHPNLERILMPEDWLGHPHRKDYPLGGVDITYENDKFIPPPEERSLREVVE